MKFKFPPPVPGVSDLHNLLIHLEQAKARDKWITDATKILEENQKAVNLLGAKETIQKNLDKAERAKDKAERAMDNARAAAQSITDDAEAKFAAREAALVTNEKELQDRMTKENNELREKIALSEEADVKRKNLHNSAQQALNSRTDDITKREGAIAARERRADNKLAEAKKMRAEAEETIKNIMAAVPKPAA